MNDFHTRSDTMNLMHENLARAQCRERLEQAHEARRGYQLARTVRLTRRAERATAAMKQQLARAV